MNKVALLDSMLDEIMNISNHPRGALGRVEDCETEMGYTLVPVGSDSPFPVAADNWEAAVISLDKKRVRLVLLHAKNRGTGALKRLVTGIQSAGYRPTIIEPTGPDMPAIMEKWGWACRRRGHGFNSYDEYFPKRPV